MEEEYLLADFTFSHDIVVCNGMVALNWYPSKENQFFEGTRENIRALKRWVHEQPNGVCFPIRGRDWSGPREFSEWDYGVAIKNDDRLFFIYESGCLESFRVDDLNFRDLVHFTQKNHHAEDPPAAHQIKTDPRKVVIISHGWSEVDGPDYPLIRTLEHVAVRAGWTVIVPDFRTTYRFSSQRGRAERVRVIYEELLCLDIKPESVVLVGHSQGGAASSLAATERVIKSCNIKGLLLYGSENPRDLDGMNWIPPLPKGNGVIVHAEGDFVVSSAELESTAEAWGFDFISLQSAVPRAKRDCWGDDINHDFTAKDLMQSAVTILKDFLSKF